MTDTLLHLRRSENGHFVLVEPTSQTVVVAEELGEAYARMCETLKDPPAPAPPHTGSPGIFAQRGAVRLAIVAVAILAPLAWVARISVEVREAELTCPPRATRSQGHPTRISETPSAAADRQGAEDDDELNDDATPDDPKPAATGGPEPEPVETTAPASAPVPPPATKATR
jgi:hypothetical protein